MNHNENVKKVIPVANKIYEECKEEGLTTEEFNSLTFLLGKASLWLRAEGEEKKLNEISW